MMGERYRIAVLLLLQPMEKIIATDTRRRLKRKFMHLRIARYVTCLNDTGNIARRTVCCHGICVRTRRCSANAMLVVCADDLRAARRM